MGKIYENIIIIHTSHFSAIEIEMSVRNVKLLLNKFSEKYRRCPECIFDVKFGVLFENILCKKNVIKLIEQPSA